MPVFPSGNKIKCQGYEPFALQELIEINIDEDQDTREWLIAQGHRTAPQIYLNDALFVEGGYQGLVKLSDEELKEYVTNNLIEKTVGEIYETYFELKKKLLSVSL